MREELEEGHFDADGHFQWNKDSEIKDNWLDNLDWMKVKTKLEANFILAFPCSTEMYLKSLLNHFLDKSTKRRRNGTQTR